MEGIEGQMCGDERDCAGVGEEDMGRRWWVQMEKRGGRVELG